MFLRNVGSHTGYTVLYSRIWQHARLVCFQSTAHLLPIGAALTPSFLGHYRTKLDQYFETNIPIPIPIPIKYRWKIFFWSESLFDHGI
jgi:hypothetical protein